MEPNYVIKPYMIEPVVYHNSDGPISKGSSFDSSIWTHHKAKMTVAWTETGGTDWLLYLYCKVLFYRFLTFISSFVSLSYGFQIGVDVWYQYLVGSHMNKQQYITNFLF